jgi:hypothetical protein
MSAKRKRSTHNLTSKPSKESKTSNPEVLDQKEDRKDQNEDQEEDKQSFDISKPPLHWTHQFFGETLLDIQRKRNTAFWLEFTGPDTEFGISFAPAGFGLGLGFLAKVVMRKGDVATILAASSLLREVNEKTTCSFLLRPVDKTWDGSVYIFDQGQGLREEADFSIHTFLQQLISDYAATKFVETCTFSVARIK